MFINYTNIIIVSKRDDIIYFTKTYLNEIMPVSVIPELTSGYDSFLSLIIYDCSYAIPSDFEKLRNNFSVDRLSKVIFIVPIETSADIKRTVLGISKFSIPYPCKKQFLTQYIKTFLSENMQEVAYNSIKKVAASAVYNNVPLIQHSYYAVKAELVNQPLLVLFISFLHEKQLLL